MTDTHTTDTTPTDITPALPGAMQELADLAADLQHIRRGDRLGAMQLAEHLLAYGEDHGHDQLLAATAYLRTLAEQAQREADRDAAKHAANHRAGEA